MYGYPVEYIDKIRHKDFRPSCFVRLSWSEDPPWILKRGGPESSGWRLISLNLKTKRKLLFTFFKGKYGNYWAVEGQRPLQELEVGMHSGPYLLECTIRLFKFLPRVTPWILLILPSSSLNFLGPWPGLEMLGRTVWRVTIYQHRSHSRFRVDFLLIYGCWQYSVRLPISQPADTQW